MHWFLLIFLGGYGGLNAFFYLHFRRAFSGRGVRRGMLAFLVLMVFSPILARFLDRSGAAGPAFVLSLAGYTWMVLVFWAFVLLLLTDLWNLVWRVAGLGWQRARRLELSARTAVVACGVVIVVAGAWGLYEAAAIRVVEVTLVTDRLPPGSDPIRIVQVSDVHLGLIIGERRLNKILALVREARPDVFVSTGDLVDASPDSIDVLAPLLAAVEAPLGKFAVLGNHEFYHGLEHSLSFHRRAGLELLRGRAVSVDGRLTVAGVDDPAGRRTGTPLFLDEAEALPPRESADGFVVLLKHQPVVQAESLGRFDLQLSGHIHGGQVFPFGLIVRLVYPYATGLHRLGQGSRLYINPGTGTWGPPMRVLAPPEVTVITLRPESPTPSE